MSTRKGEPRGLFEAIERDEAKEQAEKGDCAHPFEKKTRTVWGNPCVERLTWTCETCGVIRGRCP